MKKAVLPNELLLSGATEFLSEGKRVIIPVKGCSMHPFIVAERDCVELHPPVSLKRGNIVLARINNQFILHRVIRINDKGQVILMGDGNLYQKESCHINDIAGIARFTIRKNNKKYRLDSPIKKIQVRLWYLQPIFTKKIMLWFFHKIHRNQTSQ